MYCILTTAEFDTFWSGTIPALVLAGVYWFPRDARCPLHAVRPAYTERSLQAYWYLLPHR